MFELLRVIGGDIKQEYSNKIGNGHEHTRIGVGVKFASKLLYGSSTDCSVGALSTSGNSTQV